MNPMQPPRPDNEKISAALEDTAHEFSAGEGHGKLEQRMVLPARSQRK